jgi:uncharacterized repeat protein (TIGR03803 family)
VAFMERWLSRVLVAAVLGSIAGSSSALTPTVLQEFPANSGLVPSGALTRAPDGSFYGTTSYGGRRGGFGVIYKVGVDGKLTVIHSFDRRHGVTPMTGVTLGSDGNIYGTTEGVNAAVPGDNHATIYRLTPAGVLRTLHSFTAGEGDPYSELIEGQPGVFYGTTWRSSGQAYPGGVIYRITSRGALNIVREFSAAILGRLTRGADGNLYGHTLGDGDNALGTAFAIRPDGEFVVLHSFDAVGQPAFGVLTLAASGELVGTTRTGGAENCGTVFRMDAAGTRTIIRSQRCDEGPPPHTLVEGEPGEFYGMSVITDPNYQYRYPVMHVSSTGQFDLVHTFRIDLAKLPAMGRPTRELVVGAHGDLYGTTSAGNYLDLMAGVGSVFKLTLAGQLSVAHRFTAPLGSSPLGNLVQSADGQLYGTTQFGGRYGDYGTVFRLDSDGALTSLHSLTRAQGQFPLGLAPGIFSGGLLAVQDDLKGVGLSKVAETGALTPVHFADGTGFTAFVVVPLHASDGAFYAPDVFGRFVKVTADGEGACLPVTRHDMSPNGPLTEGAPGVFYGVTASSQYPGKDTIYRLTSAGVIDTLYTFDGSAGSVPAGALVVGPAGELYGLTLQGGAFGFGTVFRRSPEGVVTVLHSFSADQQSPGSLMLASDGRLYGVTGTSQLLSPVYGTLFSLTTDGVYETLYAFDQVHGAVPSGLMQAADGNLYGTTRKGGRSGIGVIYRFPLNGMP